MSKLAFPALSLFLSLFAGFTANAQEDHTLPPVDGNGQVPVGIRVVFLGLDEITGAQQTFSGDIALQLFWQDDRLRHNGSGNTHKSLDSVWHPQIQIVNGERLQFTFPDEVAISPSGSVVLIQRARGVFSHPFHLKDFPFDRQELKVTLVAVGHNEGTVLLQENPEKPSRIAEEFNIPDWKVLDWNTEILSRPVVSGERPLPTFEISLKIERASKYFLINVIFPLFLIICMSWIVFYIPSQHIGPRISASITAMLTLTAYRFAISSGLPKISYLTRIDWFILGSTALVFLALLEVVLTSSLFEMGKPKLARKINLVMRIAAPILFLLVALFSLRVS